MMDCKQDKVDRMAQADKLCEQVRCFMNDSSPKQCFLKCVCCLVWRRRLQLLEEALQLHDAACGVNTQTRLRERICRLAEKAREGFQKTLVIDVMAMIALAYLAYRALPLLTLISAVGIAPTTLTPTAPIPTFTAVASPLVTMITTSTPTLIPTPTPSATATPTPTLTLVPPYILLVEAGEQTYEVPRAGSIKLEARPSSNIRIGVIMLNATGQRIPGGLADYHWDFDPEDPENALRVGTLSNVLNYTVPADGRSGQLINIEVEAANYRRTVVIQITIR